MNFIHILSVDSVKGKPLHIPTNSVWLPHARTAAGGNDRGDSLNQLYNPHAISFDGYGNILIADYGNDRVVEWTESSIAGKTVIGVDRKMNHICQLKNPVDLIVDRVTDSVFISDRGNRRVLQIFRQSQTSREIIQDIECCGLALDSKGFLYVADTENHQVRRYQIGRKTDSKVVAGGNGRGNRNNQLDFPTYIFVDNQQSVYVTDTRNHRIMKWLKGQEFGELVAGGQGKGCSRKQLSNPRGLFVDQLETVYVADTDNARIIRWYRGASDGDVIAGGNGEGQRGNQLEEPVTLSFDENGDLYVCDLGNARLQQFLRRSLMS